MAGWDNGAVEPGAVESEASTEQVVESATRAERRPRDMVISLLVLLVPILLVLGVYNVFFDGDAPVRVDPAVAIDDARHADAFPVLVPTDLPSGWTPVSAAFRPVDGGRALRIGFVSPDGEGAQVVQTDAPVTTVIPAELTGASRPQGAAQIGDVAWQTYSARPGERALVLLEPTRTVIVVGSAPEADLRELAASLR